MKGQNTITLNHTTLLEAIGLWVRDTFADKDLYVVDVKASTRGMNTCLEVEVVIEPKEGAA